MFDPFLADSEWAEGLSVDLSKKVISSTLKHLLRERHINRVKLLNILANDLLLLQIQRFIARVLCEF